MSDLADLRARVAQQFEATFGRTSLAERVEDIGSQAAMLARFTNLEELREEAGDLLSAVLQLCNECGWEPADLIAATLHKITSRRDAYARLGPKIRVAIFDGAFDPVHNGHLEIAQQGLRLGNVDEVWLMPCFEHLSGKSMAAPEHRLEMCRLAVEGRHGLGVFDYEIRHQFRGDTFHLVKGLLAEEIAQVKYDFRFLLGQDDADSISSWTNADALERMIPFIVVPRAGNPPPPASAWYLRPPHQFLHEASPQRAVNSTEVRNRLRGEDATAADVVPPEVLTYIRKHDLYQASPLDVAPRRSRKLAIFTSMFDPPSRYHRQAAQQILQAGFAQVVVCPPGPRAGRREREHAPSMHRAALVDLNFQDLANVVVDLSDLDNGRASAPCNLEERYQNEAEVWHVVSDEMVLHGREGRSTIQQRWERGEDMWRYSRFVVLHPAATPPAKEDLPPHSRLIALDGHVPSAELRDRVYHGESIDAWVTPEVADYIRRHQLFVPSIPGGATRWQITAPRLLIECDERNPNAQALAERYEKYAADQPNLILVIGGDGTMLRAIRRHWRRRIPILGLNAGHVGFLANERLPDDLENADLVIYSLPMVRVEALRADDERVGGLAFGDAWIERDGGQAAWMRLEVDGQTRVPKIVGDGMLVATASGSSAYARALGAIPVPLTTPVFTLAGSNIFRPRFWKPMTLADDTVVSIVSLDRSGKRPVRGFLDGQPLGVIQSLTVQRSPIATVELAFTGEFDPSGKLLRSLFPPNEEE